MFRIKGYEPGSNITLLNTIYHKPVKDEEGKYDKDYIDLIYKDLDTGMKKIEHIVEPTYTYYKANEDVLLTHNELFIEIDKVHPIECKYRELLKNIAENTNNTEFFYDNIRNGNYKENDRLLTIPSIFNADMDIEDYYRMQFDRTYKNEPYKPTKLYFDIETDIIGINGDFPQPGQCPINAITLVDEFNKNIYTLLLKNDKNPLINEFINSKGLIDELKAFIRNHVGGWKQEHRYGLHEFNYKIMFYDEEIKMIHDMFNMINYIKPDFALAWNMAFDLNYIIERIKILGYDPREIVCHQDFKNPECYYFIDKKAQKFEERNDYACVSSYTVYLDQLITFASRRKGQKKAKITSYKLDHVGDAVTGIRKLDYSHITTSIAKLPYLDYKTFVFYNIMDTIVQLCIEHMVGDVDFAFNKALSTNTRFSKIHRQTTYLANRGVKDFYNMGYIMGNNINKHNVKAGFPGAFVADPTLVSDKPKIKINGRSINILDNLDDFDYKALYPSIIDESNMAPNTQHGKIIFREQLDPKENRFNNEYFDRTVWFIEDLVCKDRLNFCQRYLNLAGYEEMHDDIIKYFSTINSPRVGLKYVDFNGMKEMCYIAVGERNKIMCTIVESNNKVMCYKVDKMPTGVMKNEFND